MPGSVTVCVRCGIVNEFDATMHLRKPSNETYIAIFMDPEVRWMIYNAQQAVRALNAREA